ncbi:MoaD/ThiS family protein [Chloroflexota bacterium]
MVTVKIMGPLGSDLDQSRFNSYLTVELDLAGSTLADVIDQLAARYGVKVKEELLDEEGNLDYAYGIFFGDGERVADLTTQIEDGAELVILIMLGGG